MNCWPAVLRSRGTRRSACPTLARRRRPATDTAMHNAQWRRAVNTRRFLALLKRLAIGGVIGATVANAQEPRTVHLRPPNAAAQVQFTRIISVRELNDGSVLVADRQERRLVLVKWGSPDATVIGRIGHGPGEYQRIGWLYALRGDSTLFTDSFHARVAGLRLHGWCPTAWTGEHPMVSGEGVNPFRGARSKSTTQRSVLAWPTGLGRPASVIPNV